MASTIKVDNVQNTPGTNIVNKCGTTTTIGAGAGETVNVCAATVNLGRSGGTVNLTCGATQSGFGRTGTVDWVTTPKVTGDSPVTAASGSGYFLNTTAGSITINLPAGAAGSIVSLADYAATFQTYPVTVTPNGSEKIGGVNASVGLATQGQSVTFVYIDSTQGWVNTMDSTTDIRASAFIGATGGCITYSGDYKIHTFTGPGTFNVVSLSPSAPENAVDWLVVAGGGGGGGPDGGGGGGGGGYRESPGTSTGSYPVSPIAGNSAVTVTVTAFPIVVGAAGVGSTAPGPGTGGQGGTSTFSIYSSAGGGGGGAESCNPTRAGQDGGSGGGGGNSGGVAGPGGTGNTPPVSPSQGKCGGNAYPTTSPPANRNGGGGGGATVNGTTGSGPTGGPGGTGATSSIDAVSTGRSGGGGGAGGPGKTGGTATQGGGAGGTHPSQGTAGTINTGGGGGGSNMDCGVAGGSGVVILRYKYQ